MGAGLLEQYRRNVAPGPQFVARPAERVAPDPAPVRLIAFYLPQFHAIPENDEWWGAGFTEWTNVTKALPLFEGHYQPRLPRDLGFYDLSRPDILRHQAELARQFGIEGFCFHYYWFGGKRLLETPLDNLLADRSIDLPFCINWANQTWSRRWDGREQDVLVAQRYSPEDDIAFAEAVAPLFDDPRYIRVGERPLLLLYLPSDMPDPAVAIGRWREHFSSRGVNPLILMTQAFGDMDPRRYGFDGAVGFPPIGIGDELPSIEPDALFDPGFIGYRRSYPAVARAALDSHSADYRHYPGVCPDWDNSARRGPNASMLVGSTPERFGAWLEAAARQVVGNPDPDERVVFINAWNEWAEGTYLEPDQHYGCAYLAAGAAALQRTARDANDKADLRLLNEASAARPRRTIMRRAARKFMRFLEPLARGGD
jgi:lipopolysaccharide biosynthesis protein